MHITITFSQTYHLPFLGNIFKFGGAGVLATRIFEPFFTTKANQHGTGLGLAICTEIAHEHGGSIALRHSSPQGAVFCVTLPRGHA